MSTGYYLLDNPNRKAKGPDGPYRFHGYIGRQVSMGRVNVGVIHVAVIAPSTRSADAIARYFATTERQASYHTLIDSDGRLDLIPPTGTAFHVVGYNSKSLGLSFACNTDTWEKYPEWSSIAYEYAAPVVAEWSDAYNLPMRFLTKQQVLAGERGWTFHATMDPSRRTDPGAPPHGKFDLGHLFSLAKGQTPAPQPPEEEEMSTLRHGMSGDEVLEMQHLVDRFINLTGGNISATEPAHLPKDSVYGNQTALWVHHAAMRAERWVLKHPMYANVQEGSRFSDGLRAWLTTLCSDIETGTREVGTDPVEKLDDRFEPKAASTP